MELVELQVSFLAVTNFVYLLEKPFLIKFLMHHINSMKHCKANLNNREDSDDGFKLDQSVQKFIYAEL